MADRFVYECTLRWSDLDAYGHVNNSRFLTLYEEARVALMFAGARAQGLDSFVKGVVIRRHEIDYLRPLGYALDAESAQAAPTVRIELWVELVRAGSFIVGYEMYDGELLVSRARSVLVPFDLAKQAPRRLSKQEHDFLLGYAA